MQSSPYSLRWLIAAVFFVALSSVWSGSLLPAVAQQANSGSGPLEGQLRSGVFDSSEVFPGTRRDYRLYIPSQYTGDSPAHLLVCMDGLNYAKLDGAFRTPAVLDELIAHGDIPTTIAVFVNPGTVPAKLPGAASRSNRSFEYDSLGGRYAEFLIEEFLPAVLGDLNVSARPQDRAVCGISSGGICAFTVAWERPDQFGKVISHIGSFTNIRGGWAYPGLVRKTKGSPKPLKIYLQDGHEDLNNLHGNWPLGNQDLAAALQFAGYPYKLVMTEGGHSGKWAGQEFPDALRWIWDDDAPSTHHPSPQTKPDWQPPTDAMVQDDVPKGTVLSMPPWKSDIFPETTREWAIYVPAQYQPEKPAALMVFQDGERMRDPAGRWRIPTVFDNLIAQGAMPPTIAVFLNPGQDPSKPRRKNKHSNRSLEYDSLGNRYARFLLEEILPEVEQRFTISDDPRLRAIGGSSSGAICAFTVAWEMPHKFGKVYSNVGSFTNLRGGNVYPAWIRKTEPKPIRVYLSDTSGDVDNAFGSWPWANQRLASALEYMGYDVRLDWAEGYGHNADFGSSRFPDAMRWLWRQESHTPKLDTSDDLRGDLTLLELLIPGENWETVAENLGFADAPCAGPDGSFYFSDMRAPAIYHVPLRGPRRLVAAEAVSGLQFGPDGRLYGCQSSQERLISIDPQSGQVQTVAHGVRPNDLAIGEQGNLYITETRAQRVTLIDVKTGQTRTVDEGIERPNGIALTGDQGTLAVSDHGGEHTWMFRVSADGELDAKSPTMPMRLPIDYEGEFRFHEPPPYQAASRGDGMAVDPRGRFYVTSALGVQVFDPTGRPCGVLHTPDPSQPLTSCVLAGPDLNYLYVTNGKTVFRRKLNTAP